MSKIVFSSITILLLSILILYAGDAIQTQESDTLDGIVVDLTSVQINDSIITLKFKIRNTGTENQSVKINYKDCYIMDQKNQKKYYVLKDSDGNYIAGPNYDQGDGGRFWYEIEPKKSKGMWMKLPEPKDETEKITITIPGFPPFEDVKLEK